MKSRIFINGRSLITTSKSRIYVLPVGDLALDAPQIKELKGFVIIAKRLKNECDYNKPFMKSSLCQEVLVTIDFVMDGTNCSGDFFINDLKVSKKGFISLNAASSGEITVTTPRGEQ
tara:strand:- start:364 stop:714 length:351 start_codon:yes stop_codon:yes gene_type:complete